MGLKGGNGGELVSEFSRWPLHASRHKASADFGPNVAPTVPTLLNFIFDQIWLRQRPLRLIWMPDSVYFVKFCPKSTFDSAHFVQFWAQFTSDKAHIARNWTNSTSQNVNFANVGPNPFFDSER